MSTGRATRLHICECGRAFRISYYHGVNVVRDMELDTKERLKKYLVQWERDQND